MTAQGTVSYSDGLFVAQDLDPSEFQDLFTKIDARIALETPDQRWLFSLIGKNITDELTKNHGDDVPLLSGAHYSTTDRPRSIAIQVTRRFP